MLKKCLFSVLALLAVSVSGHGFFWYGNDLNPYFGITGGLSVLSGDYNGSSSLGEYHRNRNGSVSGLAGGVIGVQTYVKCAFFALQGNFLYNCLNKSERRDSIAPGLGTVVFPVNEEVRLKNPFQAGFDARFGWLFCKVTPYVLFGFESGSWTRSLINNSATSFRGIAALSTVTRKTCLTGGKVGGGVTFPMYQCLWFNFEYSYTSFGTIKDVLLDSLTDITWTHKDRIRQHSILWGINYLF